jgi:hypothetical protein
LFSTPSIHNQLGGQLLVLGELIATDAIVALNHHVTHGAIVAVLNTGATLTVQQIKGDALVFCCRVKLNGNRYQPEGE